MVGDAVGIMNLWRELTDDPTYIPEHLSREWPVRLGSRTEELHLDWHFQKNGKSISRRGEVVVSPEMTGQQEHWTAGLTSLNALRSQATSVAANRLK